MLTSSAIIRVLDRVVNKRLVAEVAADYKQSLPRSWEKNLGQTILGNVGEEPIREALEPRLESAIRTASLGVGSALSEPYDTEFEMNPDTGVCKFHTIVEGEWFEIPSERDDFGSRVEVPEHLYHRDIENALEKAGASKSTVYWSLEAPADEGFRGGYDAVHYDIRAEWQINLKEVGARYATQIW